MGDRTRALEQDVAAVRAALQLHDRPLSLMALELMDDGTPLTPYLKKLLKRLLEHDLEEGNRETRADQEDAGDGGEGL